MKIHIIDGYNVIHSLSLFKKFLNEPENGLERAREQLIRVCSEKLDNSFIVVFDGKMGKSENYSKSVIFTSEITDADTVILRLVEKYVKKGSIVKIYTRDRNLIDRCKLGGAINADPEELLVANHRKHIAEGKERNLDKELRLLKKYNWSKEFGITGLDGNKNEGI